MKRREIRVMEGDHKHTFATGALVEALQAAGLTTDDAMQVAREVEQQIRLAGQKQVQLSDLMARLQQAAERKAGREVAEALARQTPPFVRIRVLHEDGRVDAFSRRRMTSYLEKLGTSFKEAHVVVRQVEQGMRADGRREVPRRELFQRVASALEARFGRDVRARYEASLALAAELYVTEEGRGSGLPFSRGVLAQSLLAVGIDPELSHRLARRTEDQLWRLGQQRVSSTAVRRVVHHLLQEEAGEEFALRYQLLRGLRHAQRPVVVLVGGAAGVGKSVLAAELAYRLGISRLVSTDSLRQALRSLISPELSPVLHASSYAAWRAELMPDEVPDPTPERRQVERGFQTQVKQMSTAIQAIIARHLQEAMPVVIEGTHLVPGISPWMNFDRAVVVEIVLVVRDTHDHHENFDRREGHTQRQRPSADYIEHFTEIRMIQDFVIQQAQREGAAIIDTSDMERAVERAVEVVLDTLVVEQTAEGHAGGSQAGEKSAART